MMMIMITMLEQLDGENDRGVHLNFSRQIQQQVNKANSRMGPITTTGQ